MRKPKSQSNVRRPINRSTPERLDSAFLYHAKRDRSEEPRPANRDSSRKQPKSGTKQAPAWFNVTRLVLVGIVIMIVGDLLLLTPNARLVTLSSSNNQFLLRQSSIYQQAANKLLSRSILNHDKLTIDTAGVSRSLQLQFPELAEASIALPLIGHRPVVYVEPESPALLLNSKGATYVLSTGGKALIAASEVRQLDRLKLTLVSDQSQLQVQLGKVVLSAGDIRSIQTVVGQLQAQKLTPTSLSLPAGVSELDLKLTDKPYGIKFNLAADTKQQVGAFLAVKGYLEVHNIIPAAYIDVRIPTRAYFK